MSKLGGQVGECVSGGVGWFMGGLLDERLGALTTESYSQSATLC